MKMERWKHSNVLPDGSLPGGGRVITEFQIQNSIHGGCTIKGCNCKPGYWISVNFGIQNDGCVYGLTYYFKNKKEQRDFVVLN